VINPLIIRYGIFPIHQYKTKRRAGAWHKKLFRNQWMDQAGLNAWQEEKLRNILRHAQNHVPFYTNLFQANHVNIEAQDIRKEFFRIPLLTKIVIRENMDRLQAKDKIRVYTTVRTSGSTGSPVAWNVDRQCEDIHNAIKRRGRESFGFHVGESQVWLWGRDEFGGGKKAMRDLFIHNKRILGLLDLSRETVGGFYSKLQQWKPSFLYGYPSGFFQLTSLCKEKGYALNRLGVKAIITTAEILTEPHRQAIEQAFGCQVINEYGCAEAQIIACECASGNMHMNADTLMVEFLKEGQPVKPGETGDVVVTDLFNEVMPLIRYRVGDSGGPKQGPCSCGRTLPLMEITIGRAVEMVKLADGRLLHPEIFTPPHENPIFRLVERFKVFQEGISDFRVQVVAPAEQFEALSRLFTELIESQVGKGLKIKVERVSEIPRDPSGKLRYFECRVP